jgi:hypothetical protein
MFHKNKNYITTFYTNEKDEGFIDKTISKVAIWINEAGASIWLLRSKLIKANGKAEIDKIVQEEKKNLNAYQVETIYALYEIWEIWESSVWKDINRGWAKSSAISDAIDKSTKEPHILVYSKEWGYKIVSIKEYRNSTDWKPDQLNVNLVQWILRTAVKTGDPKIYEKYLTRRTLQDLALYLEGRQYQSRLIPKWIDVKNMMTGLANEKKIQEKAKIDPLIQNIRTKFWNKPEVMKALWSIGKSYWIPISPIWDIKIDEYIQQFFKDEKGNLVKEGENASGEIKTKLTLIDTQLATSIERIKVERTNVLSNLWGDSFNLSQSKLFWWEKIIVKDYTWKNVDVSKASLKTLSKTQAQEILSQISKKTQWKDIDKQTLDVIIFLWLHAELSDAQWLKAQNATLISALWKGWITIEKDLKTGIPNIKVSERTKQEVSASKKAWELAQSIIDTQSVTGKTPKEAQERLRNIDPDSQEAVNLRQLLSQNAEITQSIKQTSILLWDTEAKKIFTSSFREVTGNKDLTIDFEKWIISATLTDLESTPSQKAFARLDNGTSISMGELLKWESESIPSSPELNQITISRNSNGTYSIPLFDAKGISKEQVEEYKESTKLYAELGLSQFIPHIPLINTELRKKWIDATIDGQVSTSEQQQILKAIYSKLFWKEIISSSLGEVERAFSSALWNPVNMKSAMQHSLSAHKLISWPGASIAPDTLQKWFRENTTPETTDPLKNLV